MPAEECPTLTGKEDARPTITGKGWGANLDAIMHLRRGARIVAQESENADEMRSLASWVLSDGTHGEPARTLAKYLLEVIGEGR